MRTGDEGLVLLGGQCLLLVVVSVYHYVRDTLLSSISARSVAGCCTWLRGSVSLCSEGQPSVSATAVGSLVR